jgi:MoaA/NifB/PqqE/SkfB family radical SAM enzyme
MNNYITLEKINHINAELSNFCNSACPMCPRYDSDLKLIKEISNNSHTSLDEIKYKIGIKLISQLKIFRSCGNLGDGAMNPECLEIYEFLKSKNKKVILSLNTNGGARDTAFWYEMGQLGINVIFSIDGLEDTNHLYRRNVKWSKLWGNVESFILGGGIATWDFLIFKHNEHQLQEAENLAKKIGFKKFQKKYTTRWNDFDSDGKWMERTTIKVDDYNLEISSHQKQNIHPGAVPKTNSTNNLFHKSVSCKSFSNSNVEIYIHANGYVSPCCWLGDLTIHESKNIIKNYNEVSIKHRTLQEILEGNYFQSLWKGIQNEAGAYRLQTCLQTCGTN